MSGDWRAETNPMGVQTDYERIDEISSDLYSLLQKCDRKNVRNAYGTIQRCMAYLSDEL